MASYRVLDTLTGLLASHAQASAPMLIDRGRPISFAAFIDESRRIAGGLARLGIGEDDRVAVWLPNIPAWLTTFFALAQLRAIAVSINTRYRSHEVADLLSRSGARALVYWPNFKGIDFVGILRECDRSSLQHIETIVQYREDDEGSDGGNLLGKRTVSYASLSKDPRLESDRAHPQAGCIIFTTSGTTKAPKLVLHDQQTIVRHARNVTSAWHLHGDSRVYLVPPFCGVYGFCTATSAIFAAASLFMQPLWNAESAARDLVEHRITHMTGTDDVYAQLLAHSRGERPYPSLRYAGFAAFTPSLTDIVARADARGLAIAGLYGASEVQALFALRGSRTARNNRMLGGGKPVSAVARVRARDPHTGTVLPHGQPGELEIYAPESRMVRYFGDEEATDKAFTVDGYYRTGDLGYSVADGSFVYLARLGDSLRLGGFLVSPAEIEAVVQEVRPIRECQVIGIERPEGMRAIAFVTIYYGEQLDEARVLAHVSAKLAPYKVPIRVFAVDAFPVTISANATKIQKHLLREQAIALLSG